MADRAHEWTDREIERLEKRYKEMYSQAARDMSQRLNEFMGDYAKQNEDWLRRLSTGEVTREEYDGWLRSMSVSRGWLDGMVRRLADDAARTDQLAMDALRRMLPSVYVENANRAAYEIERGFGVAANSFELYDVDTVRRLLEADENTQIIHEVIAVGPPKESLQSLRVNLDAAKDVRWNRQKFTSAITQSVLQGESIPAASRRLMEVLNMDRRMATRAARTAITGAENAGRVDSYRRADGMGIKLEQQWVATLDDRTRHSHRVLDGQHVPVGEKFEVDGMEIGYPGDPSAEGELVWNCRCTLVAWFADNGGHEDERFSRLPDGMTYESWKEAKEAKR